MMIWEIIRPNIVRNSIGDSSQMLGGAHSSSAIFIGVRNREFLLFMIAKSRTSVAGGNSIIIIVTTR
ncbi:hypothetical protein RHGRI_031507 [Rhododendron griersonianum]|uniref:Uncharacterized protein n=1 Tax=Rhododendron griersonianum TaxID=479676 RepID=A0AAV6IAK0_9ERIC|nr:hypothetical protein RHGRI_031507 [Rhododendron griersonianum]